MRRSPLLWEIIAAACTQVVRQENLRISFFVNQRETRKQAAAPLSVSPQYTSISTAWVYSWEGRICYERTWREHRIRCHEMGISHNSHPDQLALVTESAMDCLTTRRDRGQVQMSAGPLDETVPPAKRDLLVSVVPSSLCRLALPGQNPTSCGENPPLISVPSKLACGRLI